MELPNKISFARKMNKVHNFSAGPAILPEATIASSVKALQNFSGTGLSILEVSHRSPQFVEVMDRAVHATKEIFSLPEQYEVLFLQGGASTQFLMVAYNLLNKKASYLDTGSWSTKAIKEAKLFGDVQTVASSKSKNFNFIPKDFDVAEDADYFHCTSNNTIFGTQIHHFPSSTVPMVCDMSSDILSREIRADDFGLIYAGAQKNMGPAGVTMVIVDKSLLGRVNRTIPTMMDYNTHISKGSMFNTPPVFSVFATLQTLEWVLQNGGLKEMEKKNFQKADCLYKEIDNNDLFEGTAKKQDRSNMNATFVLKDESLNDKFLKACKEAKISGIKGHRSVGGFRASMYNAMEINSVHALINVMQTFN